MVQGSGEESQTKLKAIKRKGRLRGRENMGFLSYRVLAGWLKKEAGGPGGAEVHSGQSLDHQVTTDCT